MGERGLEGWAALARERIERVISDRVLLAFLEVNGTTERDCATKDSHVCTEDGSAMRLSSSVLMASW